MAIDSNVTNGGGNSSWMRSVAKSSDQYKHSNGPMNGQLTISIIIVGPTGSDRCVESDRCSYNRGGDRYVLNGGEKRRTATQTPNGATDEVCSKIIRPI